MKRIIALMLVFASIFAMISCSRQEIKAETEEDTMEDTSEKETKAPVYSKKHKSIDEFEIDFDNPDFDPMDQKCIEQKANLIEFENEIKNYERNQIETGKILFYGSSCFTRWSAKYGNIPLEECIEGTLNHGFGGSCMHQLCYYYDRMVKPYKPRALVITSFINDKSAGYSNTEIMKLTAWLCNKAHSDFPDIPIYITDYRPINKERSDAQVKEFTELNNMLSEYAEKHENIKIIELSKEPFYYTSPEFAGSYKNINGDIFISDNVHFTPEGYAMLTEVMKKAIAEVL